MAYHISKSAIEKRSKLLSKLTGWLSVFAVLLTLASLLFQSMVAFGIVFFLMSLFWIVGFLAFRKNLKELIAFAIELNSDGIVCRREGFPDISIRRQDIQRIWEVKDPAIIVEDCNNVLIQVPNELDGFDIVRGVLLSWCALSDPPYESRARVLILGIYSFIVVLVLALIFQSPRAFLYLSVGWFAVLWGLGAWEKTRPNPRTGVRDWSPVLGPIVAIVLISITVLLLVLLWK